jgi:hypothetical protein
MGTRKKAEDEITKGIASKCVPYSSPNTDTVIKSGRLRLVGNKAHMMEMKNANTIQ